MGIVTIKQGVPRAGDLWRVFRWDAARWLIGPLARRRAVLMESMQMPCMKGLGTRGPRSGGIAIPFLLLGLFLHGFLPLELLGNEDEQVGQLQQTQPLAVPESPAADNALTESELSEGEPAELADFTFEPALVAPSAPPDPLLFESGPTRVKFSVDAVVQVSGVTGSWWNLSEQFAPDAGYKPDRARIDEKFA